MKNTYGLEAYSWTNDKQAYEECKEHNRRNCQKKQDELKKYDPREKIVKKNPERHFSLGNHYLVETSGVEKDFFYFVKRDSYFYFLSFIIRQKNIFGEK